MERKNRLATIRNDPGLGGIKGMVWVDVGDWCVWVSKQNIINIISLHVRSVRNIELYTTEEDICKCVRVSVNV